MMMVVEISCRPQLPDTLTHPEPGLREKTRREITTETGQARCGGSNAECGLSPLSTIQGNIRETGNNSKYISSSKYLYFKKVYLNFKKSFSTTFCFFQMLKVHIIHHDYNSFFFMSVCFTTNIISNLSPLHFEVLNTWKVSTILLHLFAAQLTTVSDEGGISNILKFMWLHAACNLFFHLCTSAH